MRQYDPLHKCNVKLYTPIKIIKLQLFKYSKILLWFLHASETRQFMAFAPCDLVETKAKDALTLLILTLCRLRVTYEYNRRPLASH